jgi:hypothetical protein
MHVLCIAALRQMGLVLEGVVKMSENNDAKVLVKGQDSTDTSPLYTPTVEFERFLIEARESIMSEVGQFDTILTGLIMQTGSIAAARSLFFSTLIAEYLNLSESESSKRLLELVRYANALLQIGQHMKFLQDWK